MKPHLPLPLRRALLSCIATVALTLACGSDTYAATELPDSSTLLTLTFNEAVAPDLLLSEDALLVSSEELFAPELSDDENSTSAADVTSLVSTVTSVSTDVADTDNSDFTTHLSSGTLMLAGAETYTNGSYTRSNETEHLTGSQDFRSYESILFDQNEVISSSSNVYGGAIYSSGSSLSFTGNGAITFSGNTASSSSYYAEGGAIYASSSMLTFTGNGAITFSENTASTTGSSSSAGGGAIYAYDGPLTFAGNGAITFSGNTGGAIVATVERGKTGTNGSPLTFTDNGDITFSWNTASAIYAYNSSMNFAGNGNITFSGNTASTTDNNSSASGGAIYEYSYLHSGYSDILLTFSDNGDIAFSENTASTTGCSSGSYGGAIDMSRDELTSITLIFSGNGDITFSRNTASTTGSSSFAYGGAICAFDKCSLTFTGNGAITFSGNTASSDLASAYGGAIYAIGNSSTHNAVLTIQDSALFEKNTEIGSGTYRLRSIYQSGSGSLELSASTAKSIEFRDSIYSEADTVIFNRDYTKSDGSTQVADGIIRFTGKYTAADLAEMKGREGTADELTNSLTSEITRTVQLMGGTLSVEDGAVLKTGGLTIADGAALALQSGTLTAADKTITMAEGASITTQGSSTLSFGTLTLTQVISNSGTLALAGKIQADNLTSDEIAIHADVNETVGTSGFSGTMLCVQVVRGGTCVNNGTTVTYADKILVLGSDGYATAIDSLDYSNYLLTGTDSVSVSAIHAVGGGEAATITQTGGTLTADADATTITTGGSLALTGGTLSGSISGASITASGGTLAATLNGSNTLTGSNYALSSALTNTGTLTLKGSFDVSALSATATDSVLVNLDGTIGSTSGFTRAAGYTVQIVNDGTTIAANAVATRNGDTLTLSSDGVGTLIGAIDYSNYLLTGTDSTMVSAIHAVSGAENATITQTGGTLTADADATTTTTGGSIALTGGSLSGSISGASITATGGTLAAGLTGSNTLTGSNYALSAALTNTGSLTLKGTFDASALSATATDSVLVGLDGTIGSTSGFTRAAGYTVQIVNGGTTIADAAAATHNGDSLIMGSDGIGTHIGAIDYSNYLLTGTDSASVSAIHAVSGAEAATITQTGGTLTADADATTTTTGGSIALTGGTLSGSISGASITATGGTLAAGLSGSNTLTGSNYALSAALTNTGSLTLKGTFDASALTTTAYSTLVNLDGTTGGASGFTAAAGYTVQLVNGGTTVAGEATVTRNGDTLTVSSAGVGTFIGTIDYSTYMLAGTDSAAVSAIHAVSGAENATITQTGGTLTVDENAVLAATGGKQVVQAATVTGDIISSALSVTGNSTIDGNLTLSDGATLNLTLNDAAQTTPLLRLSGTLTTGKLSLNITGDVPTAVYTLLTLDDASQYDTSLWTSDKITLTGNASFDDLAWENGSLICSYYAHGIYTREGYTTTLDGQTFTEYSSVLFADNTHSTSGDTYGGAFNVTTSSNSLSFTGNGVVNFRSNVAKSSYSGTNYWAFGGAIHTKGVLNISDNKNVDFSQNRVLCTSTKANGGAIEARSTVTIRDNDSVSFSGNTATATYASTYSTYEAHGGAMCVSGNLSFVDNGALTFSGNKVAASSGSIYARGGALYATAALSLEGSALFEKNTEVNSGTYRLRSIYHTGGTLDLSAATDNSIEFRDSIYSSASTVIFNRDYAKSDGTTQTADGTIRFTGKYTADDLAEMKGSAGTAAELTNSLTSEITGTVQLMGGTLSVEGGAILQTGGLTIADGAALTLQGATLTATGKAITMAEGASIATQGNSTLSFGTLTLTQAISNSGTLTISGTILTDGLTLRKTGDATHLNEDGEKGANGFAKSAAYEVTVVNGGTVVNAGATVTHADLPSELTLNLGADGVAKAGGITDYSNYLLVDASAAVSAIHAVSGAENATITQTGGTLTADADATTTTTGGSIELVGGTLSGSISDASIIATSGTLAATLSGANTLTGNDYVLRSALTNTGTLTISGSILTDDLTLHRTGATHINVAGVSGTNGFAKTAAYDVTLVNCGTVVDDGATITHADLPDELTLSLGSDGVATAGGVIDYSNYLLTNASTSVSAIHAVGGAEAATITQTGGTLTANADATTTTAGGSITLTGGMLSGSISGASITASGGTLAAALSGANTLTGNNYYLRNVLTNTGTLTVKGTVRTDGLTLRKTGDATHVNVAGESGASGFAKSAAYDVTLVNGGTVVNAGATVTHADLPSELTLNLGSDGVATAGGITDYSNYLLTGSDSASASAIHAVSGAENATITQTGGTLTVDDDATVLASGGSMLLESGNLTVSGTASVSADTTYSGEITLQNAALSGGALELARLNQSSTGSIVNVLTGTCNLTKASEGTLELSGSNTFKGTVTISNGTLKVGSATALGASTNKVTLTGGTLDAGDVAAAYAITATGGTLRGTALAKGVTVGGDVQLGERVHASLLTLNSGSLRSGSIADTNISAKAGEIASDIVGSGKLVKSGTGTVTLSGTNTYEGSTTVSVGELEVTGSILNSVVTVKTGATLLNNGTVNHIVLDGGTLSSSDSAGITLAAGQELTVAGGSVVQDVTLNTGAELTLEGAALNSSLYVNGGTLSFTGDTSSEVSGFMVINDETNVLSDLQASDTPYLLLTATAIEENASLVYLGTAVGNRVNGTLDWSDGEHLYLTVEWDTNTTELGWTEGSGTWTVDGEAEWDHLAGHESDVARFYNGDAVSFTTGGEVSIEGTVKPRDIAVSGAEALTFTGEGSIAGASTLEKSGSGTLRIETANSYTGGTTISGGTVEAANADALGSGAVDVQGGTLAVDVQELHEQVSVGQNGALAFGSAEDARGTMTASSTSGFTLGAGAVGYDSSTDTAMLSGTDDDALVLDNVLVDMAAGSTLKLENVVLAASAQLTDDTATLQADGLTVQVGTSNAVLSAPQTMTATSLTVSGHAAHAAGDAPLWPTAGSTVRTLTLNNISNYAITGSSLIFDLSSYSSLADATSESYVGIVFETATMDLSNLTVTATMNGKDYTAYYDTTQPNGTAYFDLTAATVPEPSTALLSLLALAGLAARRRRVNI